MVDTDILQSPGFIILVVMAVGATLAGFIWGRKMEWGSLPIWQLILIIVVEIFASYFITARG